MDTIIIMSAEQQGDPLPCTMATSNSSITRRYVIFNGCAGIQSTEHLVSLARPFAIYYTRMSASDANAWRIG